MVEWNIKILSALLYLVFALLSAGARAGIICATNCPTTSDGSPDPALPQITEFSPLDGSNLFIDNDGLIILDVNIYDNLLNLVISPTSPVYMGVSSLPAGLTLPDTLRLSTVQYTGGLSLTGGTIDYVLLREFSGNTELNITSSTGVLVADTGALAAVPVPGAMALFSGGLSFLLVAGRRKK